MEIELDEEGVVRLDVPQIIGQTVGVVAHGSCKEGCKGNNLSAHGSVHHEGALQIDHLKGESRRWGYRSDGADALCRKGGIRVV